MSTTTIAGHLVNVNDEGFMTEYDEWNEDLGRELASMIGIDELTAEHWEASTFYGATSPNVVRPPPCAA